MTRTQHRKLLDKLQKKYSYMYSGIVLDIGGRKRGMYDGKKNNVSKWIYADIEKKHEPDIVLDVSNMKQIATGSINTINAIELFEHVKQIQKGLDECTRVLTDEGTIIISAPFMYHIHADPHDYQRWTKEKWVFELERRGFKILHIEPVGLFFTVLTDMKKAWIKTVIKPLRYIFYLTYPWLHLVAKLDQTAYVRNNKKLSAFVGGYFIIGKKSGTKK